MCVKRSKDGSMALLLYANPFFFRRFVPLVYASSLSNEARLPLA